MTDAQRAHFADNWWRNPDTKQLLENCGKDIRELYHIYRLYILDAAERAGAALDVKQVENLIITHADAISVAHIATQAIRGTNLSLNTCHPLLNYLLELKKCGILHGTIRISINTIVRLFEAVNLHSIRCIYKLLGPGAFNGLRLTAFRKRFTPSIRSLLAGWGAIV